MADSRGWAEDHARKGQEVTNYDGFTKPIIHFGNAHLPRPVEKPVETVEEESK